MKATRVLLKGLAIQRRARRLLPLLAPLGPSRAACAPALHLRCGRARVAARAPTQSSSASGTSGSRHAIIGPHLSDFSLIGLNTSVHLNRDPLLCHPVPFC